MYMLIIASEDPFWWSYSMYWKNIIVVMEVNRKKRSRLLKLCVKLFKKKDCRCVLRGFFRGENYHRFYLVAECGIGDRAAISPSVQTFHFETAFLINNNCLIIIIFHVWPRPAAVANVGIPTFFISADDDSKYKTAREWVDGLWCLMTSWTFDSGPST